MPSESPVTEAPHEKKFNKNVDSSKWTTIKNGRMIPNSIRNTPKVRRKRGLVIRYP